MHTITLTPGFNFGDWVRINSQTQNVYGVGRIFAITVMADGDIDYMIEMTEQNGQSMFQPGILENELTLLY